MALGKPEAISLSKGLLRAGRSGALSTALPTHEGWPYGSLVTFATDCDGAPIFLFSDLADHARNLKGDPRASLLIEQTSGRKRPQTGPRVTLLGKLRKSKDTRHAERFFARHPQARMYAGFGDFHFYKMTIERAHFVGGFARAVWFRGRELLSDPKAAKALIDAEQGIIEHMNSDHADAIDLYARVLCKRRGEGWKMVGVDPDGADLMLDERLARLPFGVPVADAGAVRDELVRLVGIARTAHQKI